MSIKSQLAKIAAKRTNDMEQIARASLIRVGNRITSASPVDKGIFINEWKTSIGKISYSIRGTEDRSGSGSIDELQSTVNVLALGATLYFNNPMPYGPRLEYDGWSEKAPNGFLRINTAKWESIVNEEVLKRR